MTAVQKKSRNSRHEEFTAQINATVGEVFEQLDDHMRLSAHMGKPSWKMGWGKMETALDVLHGRAVGSHIVLSGQVFGIQLFVDEMVTLREPPFRKAWETVGEPRLLVIGSYLMSFDLKQEGNYSKLSVAIDYEIPKNGIPHFLGRLFGSPYAKWCTRQIVRDAQRHFSTQAVNISMRPVNGF